MWAVRVQEGGPGHVTVPRPLDVAQLNVAMVEPLLSVTWLCVKSRKNCVWAGLSVAGRLRGGTEGFRGWGDLYVQLCAFPGVQNS
jgi:hypothetical protein